jgi:hypothetical protein
MAEASGTAAVSTARAGIAARIRSPHRTLRRHARPDMIGKTEASLAGLYGCCPSVAVQIGVFMARALSIEPA